MRIRNTNSDIVNISVMELMQAHERKDALAQTFIGKTYCDGITEIMNQDFKKFKSFDKIVFVFHKKALLTLIWLYLKVMLFRNRWLLKRKVKDELELCHKYINKVYKID